MARRGGPADRGGCGAPYEVRLDWPSHRCSLPVYQNLSGDVTTARQTRQDLASLVKGTEELIRESVTVLARAARRAGRGSGEGPMSEKTVVLVGTLDTKGAEYQYMRDRLALAGGKTILVDVGTLDRPLAQADLTRDEGAAAARAD